MAGTARSGWPRTSGATRAGKYGHYRACGKILPGRSWQCQLTRDQVYLGD